MTRDLNDMSNFADEVRANGGVLLATLETLRNERGYGRLGKHVLPDLKKQLKRQGLGVYPPSRLDPDKNTSPRYWEEVNVYDTESAVGQVFDVVLHPSEDGNKILLGLIEGGAEDILEQIRDLLR